MLKTFWAALALASFAYAQPAYVALGDSLGEGAQSADAIERTQPHSYANIIASQLNVSFPLPLIQGGPFSVVGGVTGRTRIDPTVASFDLAVAGATTTSILNQAASTPVANETDLVLSPRTGTQIQIAQSLQAPFMTCWVGSDDALGAILAFDQLDASQLTPVSVFSSNFQQISQSVTGWNNAVVFANVPNVIDTGFLFDNQDLIRFTGQDFGLPDGSYTTAVAMLLLKFGLAGSTLLQNPNWVLDPTEVATIESTIQQYNQIIAQDAAAVKMPVVDIYSLLDSLHTNPITIGNVTLTTNFLGGLFSLDGSHPSDIGYAIVANEFLKVANAAFSLNAPLLTNQQLSTILAEDPFVDFNGNLKVRGRPLAGLLETLGPFLGISGDFQDSLNNPAVNAAAGARLMKAYFTATGQDPNTAWTQKDAIEAMRHVFGLKSAAN